MKRNKPRAPHIAVSLFACCWLSQCLRLLREKVEEGIELAAYESIPGNQRINLFEILGDQLPSEVINNLETQVNHIGKQ
ncbi:unnamed protein product [Leptidea sinapis]|uniref:Uncharacterized protein n=1 Tax=Leptidea sinapis TaxID=189913 RepID=A0A5E4QLN9_9NEOP|nr:unnamed protein product [Leptidea sinapis]